MFFLVANFGQLRGQQLLGIFKNMYFKILKKYFVNVDGLFLCLKMVEIHHKKNLWSISWLIFILKT